MAKGRHYIRLDAEGNAVTVIKKTEKASQDLERQTDDTADKTKKSAVSFGKAMAALAAFKAVVVDTVGAYQKLDAAQGRLTNALRNAGAGQREFAQAQRLAIEMRNQFGITEMESVNALRQLVDASGDASKAMTDYRLAVDIASQENMSLEQATSLLAKARNGEVEELKNLRGLNKDQAQQLGQVEDATERASIAVQFLTESYDGAAEANAGLEDKSKALKAQFETLQTATGQLLVEIGEGGVGLVGAIGSLLGIVEKDALEGDLFGRFADGMRRFASAVGETFDYVVMLVAGLDGLMEGKSLMDIIDEAESAKARARLKQQQEQQKQDEERKEEVREDLGGGKTATERLADADKKGSTRPRSARKQKGGSSVDPEDFEGGFDDAEAEFVREKELEAERLKLELMREQDALRQVELEHAIRVAEIKAQNLDPEMRSLRLMQEQERAASAMNQAVAQINQTQKQRVPTEQELAGLANQEAQARMSYVDALTGGAKGLISTLAQGEAAKRASAALDAAVLSYKAVEMFVLGDYARAGAAALGAAQATAVAAGAGGGVSGGGAGKMAGGAAPPQQRSPEDLARMNARVLSEELRENDAARSVTYNLNWRSVARPDYRDARQMLSAVRDAAGLSIGGPRT